MIIEWNREENKDQNERNLCRILHIVKLFRSCWAFVGYALWYRRRLNSTNSNRVTIGHEQEKNSAKTLCSHYLHEIRLWLRLHINLVDPFCSFFRWFFRIYSATHRNAGLFVNHNGACFSCCLCRYVVHLKYAHRVIRLALHIIWIKCSGKKMFFDASDTVLDWLFLYHFLQLLIV